MAVLIDKGTYEKYQNAGGNLSSTANSHLKLNTVNPSDAAYAQIVPDKDSGMCPMLAADHLCGIQKEFGMEYLSATCSIYPRVLNSVHGEMETSLYLSCPEAARLVLLNPAFTRAEGQLDYFRTDQFSRLATCGAAVHKPYSYFNEVQDLVATIIQDRTRPIWQRLFLVGELCRTLDQIAEPAEDASVPGILAEYESIIETGALRDGFNGLRPNPVAQLTFVLKLAEARSGAGDVGPRFLECVQDFLDGVHFTERAKLIPSFVKAEKEYFDPFFAERPFILENYLLNYIYRTLFPFGREASAHQVLRPILDEYMLLISHYLMIKVLLIGMAGKYREAFGTEHVVKLVQSMSKAVEHYPTFLNLIVEFVHACNLMDVQGVATLLPSSEGVPDKDVRLPALAEIGPLVAQGERLQNLIAC
jgi:lysine-N-methylase